MIRVVTIAALLCLLVLVLYLPSAHPPERFLAQIRSEHQAMEALWGEAPALRILDRALCLQGAAREATPVPPTAGASAASGVDGAVAREMASVNQRLFGNTYFRAIDALMLLAAFRLSAMLEWLPRHGGTVQRIRSRPADQPADCTFELRARAGIDRGALWPATPSILKTSSVCSATSCC